MATTLNDQQRYRAVMSHFATGVTVVTCQGPQGPAGLTANAVCSLSLDPLLVLVCFARTARTLPAIQMARRFCVNVLREDQRGVAAVFASKLADEEKFTGVPYAIRHDLPVLDGSLAWLGCDLLELHPGGDHMIGVGAVRYMGHDGEGEPLVWYRGSYTRIIPPRVASDRLEPGDPLR